MSTDRAGTGRIVVGVDGSEGSRQALTWSVEEAAIRRCPIEALTVRSSAHDPARMVARPVDGAEPAESAGARLAEVIGGVSGEHAEVEIEPVVLRGDPAETLCRRAATADLLVVGSRGHGTVAGLRLGSVSSACAHHSPRPVAIVPPSPPGQQPEGLWATRRIVVGVDGSPGSLRALRWAVDEAGARDATLVALMVWPGIETDDDMLALELATLPSLARRERTSAEHARERLRTVVSELAGGSPVAIEPVLLEGDPARTLCRRAAAADLLVVGSRGHGTVAGLLLGSVSSTCAHHSPRPVVIVPAGRDPDAPIAPARG